MSARNTFAGNAPALGCKSVPLRDADGLGFYQLERYQKFTTPEEPAFAREGACVPANMMKSLFVVVFLVAMVFSAAVLGQAKFNIIPKPETIEPGDGTFVFNRKTKLGAIRPEGRRVAEAFNRLTQQMYGFKLEITQSAKKNVIYFVPAPGVRGKPVGEWHTIDVEPDFIRITGQENGMFYAAHSLLQMFPVEIKREAKIPVVKIRDKPRFPYRGMHLDVARHFMPVSFVKKYIDLMAQYKFNQFHWHLTDDQGWRVEIKKYPKLTEIGSKRSESHDGVYSTIFKGDGRPVAGFYTQDEIRDVVAYAKARYVNVIPEIELPGHASAALAAYPEFGCKTDYKYEVKKTWGIFKEVYCPTDATFKFLEDVLDETIKLFPDSPYIHIGGDEVLKDFWKESPFVQELMKRENLKDEHEVQSYFVGRIEKFVNSKGKKIIGWDEILEGGVAPNATIMSWRGMKGGIQAAKEKHDVIMTPTDFCYFDYGQGDPAYEPLNIGGYVPLEKVYSFEPVPKELTADEQKYIIGGQANIWTEYLETPAAVEYMAFPRMLALSEVLWSKKEDRYFPDFQRRLAANLPRLDAQNVNYRIPEPPGLRNVVIPRDRDFVIANIASQIPGAQVLFTTDGSTPNEKSLRIPAKFLANPRDGETLTLKTIVVLPSGRKSSVYAATFIRKDYVAAVEPAGKTAGVAYSLYVPSNAFAQDTPAKKGESRSIGLQQFAQVPNFKDSFGVTFDGYINVPADGIYEFQVDSTWDASLSIGGETLIDEAGTKERAIRSAIIPLKAGWHKFAVHYDHRGGEMFFRVRWGLKGQGLRQIGGGELVH
ncbi:MAG: family 20 glycosylhydrolase [Pyrinomonadaceae bacterium]